MVDRYGLFITTNVTLFPGLVTSFLSISESTEDKHGIGLESSAPQTLNGITRTSGNNSVPGMEQQFYSCLVHSANILRLIV
jgi:hypothetical protein